VKNFEYGKPASIEQALAFLNKEAPGVFLMGGGTDLLGEIKEGIVSPAVVLDLKAIPGLAGIRKEKDTLVIGAAASVADVADDAEIAGLFPVLHQAAAVVASPQLRIMGTVGGNLCQRPRCWYYRDAAILCTKKGGSKCYAEKGRSAYHAIFAGGFCWSVYPSDLAPALIALGAQVVLATMEGDRSVPLSRFYAPPIVNVRKENVLTGREILKEVRVPLPKPGDKSAYIKFIERGAWDFAVVSAAVWASASGNSVRDIRIVCGGVAPIPWSLAAAEDALRGGRASEASIRQAAAKAAAQAAPLKENGYKVDLLKTIVTDAVLKALRPSAP
jgi:xanthine dehydrogenase YagS FAD-binding subunit